MFSFFKPKQPVVPEIDFSGLGTDLHSHLIPGIDDGAQNVQQSVELIKILMDLGFRKIITTPHIMGDYFRNNSETITTGLTILKEELVNLGLKIHIEAAAEYYLDEEFEEKIEQGRLLSLSNKYLLFEISFSNAPLNLYDIIEKIKDRGYIPILAHPERYTYLHGSIVNYRRIKDTGCHLQLNTVSLTGYYGKPVQKMAESLVDNLLIDFLGSDMHHIKHANALRAALQEPYVYRLLTDYPLLNGLL